MIQVALLYIICASTFTIAKEALNYGEPIFFTAVRMLVGGTILLGYYRFSSRMSIVIKPEHYWLFVQAVFFYMYCSYVLDNVALKYLSSAKACLFYNLSPFLSALFSYFWFGEHMTVKKWVGLLIGFAAFLPVIMAPSKEPSINASLLSWPELMMFGALLSSVYGWIIVRKLVKEIGYPAPMINGIAMLGASVLGMGTSYMIEPWYPIPVTNPMLFAFYTLLIVVVSNIIFVNFYTVLLKRYTATLLSFSGFMTPLFAAALGWLFLGEKVSVDFFATTGLVLVGLSLFYYEELRQGYIS